MPLIFFAKWMGAAARGVVFDPFWGPILITWFVASAGTLSVAMYVWPRRVHLAIYEQGFVYQKFIRRHAVRFDEITECVVVPNSGGLTLILANSTRLWFQNFLITFPREGVAQLLELIDKQPIAGGLRATPVDADLKARFRRAGWAIGLVLYVVVILVPVIGEKERAVTAKVFGKTVWGVPNYIFVSLLFAVLFAPLVYVLAQLFTLKVYRQPTSMGLYNARELRRARIVATLGLIYFIILATIWVAFQ
jgi:hypothetical protein